MAAATGERRASLVAALLATLAVAATTASAQSGVQVPPAIQREVDGIQDRFSAVLDDECPRGQCYPVGCRASRFDTLDKTQTSSLPGLDEDPPAEKPQYRLAAVQCELAYEPTVKDTDLARIRQRVRQKVKTVGVELNLVTRVLEPKPEEEAKPAPVLPPPAVPLTPQAALIERLLPFAPWFALALILTFSALAIIWGARRLGRVEHRAPGARTRSSDATPLLPRKAEPTPRMLLTRIGQLSHELTEDRRLIELTFKRRFDDKDFDELALVLTTFGPELLGPFKERAEYRETLAELSKRFSEVETDKSPDTTWRFLDRLERDMIAAKVRIDAEPLADHFAFLAAIDVEEFVIVLRDLAEAEALAAVTYAPRRLRERFFGHANPAFTAKFVEHLAKVDRMPDAFVRGVAAKLRRIYKEKGDELKSVRVDKGPLLEDALNALAPSRRRELMSELSAKSPELARVAAGTMYFDDSLPLLPIEIVTEALLTVTPEEGAAYLAAFPWGKELSARLNPRLAEGLKRHWPQQPSLDEPIARTAREKLAAFVKKRHAEGAVDLAAINAQIGTS